MRGGWIGTIAASLLLLIATIARGEKESLFLEGTRVHLDAPLVEEPGEALVPLDEFGRLVGVESSEGPNGATTLRFREGRVNVDESVLPRFDGVTYISLERLVGLSGGAVRRVGGAIHVESEPASMSAFDVSEERIVARFDAFVPVEVLEVGPDELHIRFHHCTAAFTDRLITLDDGPMTRVLARTTAVGGLDVIVGLREVGALRIKRFEAVGFYSVTIEVGAEPRAESVWEIHQGMRLHELDVPFAAGTSILSYLRVENWRMDYRVRPAIPVGEVGDLGSLTDIVAMSKAAGGIAAGDEPSLLVVDTVPLSMSAGLVNVLEIDPFGRITGIRATGKIVLSVEGCEFPIDGVNRPLAYGEAIAYPPGYEGPIAEGVPGRLFVLKLRGGRVVSAYGGTFVDRDATATLIVASGEACVQFSTIPLGAEARLICIASETDGGVRALTHAVTIEGALVRDGVPVDRSEYEDLGQARAWNVLAVDWHGGLILLAVIRDARSAGATFGDVQDFLRGLPVPVRDAYVLDSGAQSSLVVRADGEHEVGGGDDAAVGLLLLPISE